MNLFSKIATVAAGAFAAIISTASAAVLIESPDASQVLTPTNPIAIINEDLTNGQMLNDVAVFTVGDGVFGGTGDVDVRFSSGTPSGIANMVVSFSGPGIAAPVSFNVTDSMGLQTLFDFTLNLVENQPVTVTITGMVFEGFRQAEYDIFIQAQAIPLPAAGIFLLTGLAGAAGLRARKKA